MSTETETQIEGFHTTAPRTSYSIYLSSLIFCTIIGLIFGFGLAHKAVRIPTLDAIKN